MDSTVLIKPFPLMDFPGEIRDMVYEHVLFASADTNDSDQRETNLGYGSEINTNIFLTNRKVFEEARNVLIDAGLVHVSFCGAKLESLLHGAILEDKIQVFHWRYRGFCLMKHQSE
jgi:hypothetical protein